jgi:hypothetical protein
MRRFLLTLALASLGVSSAAHAGVIVTSSRGPSAASGWDEITFTLTGYNGADATFVGVNRINSLSGTFTAVGSGAVLSAPGTASAFRNLTTNGLANDGTKGDDYNPPRSYVNFDSTINDTLNTPFSRTPSGVTPTSFTSGTGGWFTSTTDNYLRLIDTTVGPNDDEVSQTLVAQIYVTPGADVSFTGLYNSDASNSQAVSFSSVLVPEPAAIGLLSMAGVSLLRRRLRNDK